MKNAFTALLSLALILSLAACGQKEEETVVPVTIPVLTEAPTQAPTEPPTQPPTAAPTEPVETAVPTEAEAVEEAIPQETKVPSAAGVIANTPSVNVRKGPSVNTKIVKKLNQGDAVSVYESVYSDGADWGRIDDGWVALKYIKLEGEIPKPEGAGEPGVIYNTASLNVRKEPSASAEKVAQLKRSDTVYVYEVVKKNGARWGRIDEGWISMDYVQVPSDSNGGPLNRQPPAASENGQSGSSQKPERPTFPEVQGDPTCEHNWMCIAEEHPTTKDVYVHICACGHRSEGQFGQFVHLDALFAQMSQGLITQEEMVRHNHYIEQRSTVTDNPGSRTWQCSKCQATKTIAYDADP